MMSDRNATVDFFFLSSTLLYPWVWELNLEMEQFFRDKLMINSNIFFRWLDVFLFVCLNFWEKNTWFLIHFLYPWVLELNLKMEQFLFSGQINDKFEHCFFLFSFMKEENRVRRMPLNWEYFKFFWPWTPDAILNFSFYQRTFNSIQILKWNNSLRTN